MALFLPNAYFPSLQLTIALWTGMWLMNGMTAATTPR